MEQIAFISGGVFTYWSSVILALACVTAIALFASLYLFKTGRMAVVSLTVPLAFALSLVLARLVHWYCRTDSYDSLYVAMTDYLSGGYALAGVFAGCLLTACLLRLIRVEKNLPRMLDCMALAGGAGIAVGRLASVFNLSDRGVVLNRPMGLPFGSAITDGVSGEVQYRLATFMLQSLVTGGLVLALLIYWFLRRIRRKRLKDGDTCLIFLMIYGASQILFDSTRYDSLYLRSNGFISVVQILGLAPVLVALIVYCVAMVRANGMRWGFFLMWLMQIGCLGGAGYMEYYVQRHGDQVFFAYSVMAACLVLEVILILLTRAMAIRGKRRIKPVIR